MRRRAGGTFLPLVGPFASLAATSISGLADITYSSLTRPISSRTSPITRNTVTVNSGVTLIPAAIGNTRYSIFIWCNKLILNGTINMTGDSPGDGDAFFGTAGDGGWGGSGGGGAAGDTTGTGIFVGGNGATAGGAFNGDGNALAFGGAGYANLYNTGYASYGTGGTGAQSSDGLASGAPGGNGCGGGGGGGYADSTSGGAFGGGGGSGGGLITIATNWLTRTTAAGQLIAQGTAGGAADGSGFSGNGGAGGGGCIWVASKRYDGNLTTADVAAGGVLATAGSIQLFEITSAGLLVAHTLWTDTWNNS